jgi:hypothetical protein
MGNSHPRDTSEEDRAREREAAEKRATEKAKKQAESRRQFYESERLKYVNDSQYVQILGDIYSKDIANSKQLEKDMSETNQETFQQNSETETKKIKKSLDEAKEVNKFVSNISQSNTDDEIYKILKQTNDFLKNDNNEISTKVYFISEVISKAFGHFYVYNSKNQETHFNYLLIAFPRTFKDDYLLEKFKINSEKSVKNKYKKFISLITLAKISKNITSSELYPYHEEPDIDYFKTLSEPIIKESMSIITEFMDENDEVQRQVQGLAKGAKGPQSAQGKIKPANNDEQDKYKIIVI